MVLGGSKPEPPSKRGKGPKAKPKPRNGRPKGPEEPRTLPEQLESACPMALRFRSMCTAQAPNSRPNTMVASLRWIWRKAGFAFFVKEACVSYVARIRFEIADQSGQGSDW